MSKEVITKKVLLMWAVCAFLLIKGVLLNLHIVKTTEPDNMFERFQEVFEKRVSDLRNLVTLSSENDQREEPVLEQTEQLEDNEISLFIYRNDSLVFWTNQTAEIPPVYSESLFRGPLVVFGNRFYLVEEQGDINHRNVGLMFLYEKQDFEKQLHAKGFHEGFNLPQGSSLIFNRTGQDIYVENEYLFSVKIKDHGNIEQWVIWVLYFVFLAALLFFVYSLFIVAMNLRNKYGNELIIFIGLIAAILLIRSIIFYFRFPAILHNSELFNPAIMAVAPSIPSLGDLLANSLLLLMIAWFYYQFPLSDLVSRKGFLTTTFKGFVPILIIFLFQTLQFELIQRTVINSVVSFDLNNIFSLSPESILGLTAIGAILTSYFLISAKLFSIAKKSVHSSKILMACIFAALIIFILWNILTGGDHWIMQSKFVVVFLFVLSCSRREMLEQRAYYGTIPYLMLFAIYATLVISQANNHKEIQKRKLLAIEISTGRDKVAEYVFSEINKQVSNDTILMGLLSDVIAEAPGIEEQTIDYLKQNYFGRFWLRYDVLITVCFPGKQLHVKPTDQIVDCHDYFMEQIRIFGEPTQEPNLFYMDPGSGEIFYLAVLDFQKTNSYIGHPVTIFIEISSKGLRRGIGYPELLLDDLSSIRRELAMYSYVYYFNGEIVRSVGQYSYSLVEYMVPDDLDGFTFFYKNGFHHLKFRTGSDSAVVISKREPGLFGLMAPFAYLFIFLGLFICCFFVIINLNKSRKNTQVSFRNRIQNTLFLFLLFSFMFSAVTSLFYIVRLNNSKNKDVLGEKNKSVLVELETELSDYYKLTEADSDFLRILLARYSQVFFTDINLYDTRGMLLASSRPEIFDEGLISKRMNQSAFQQLAEFRRINVIHKEQIRNHNFLSAYSPVKNYRNQIIGFLNLPYFARQGELRHEISNFLVTFTNIYVILIALGLLITLFLSNFLLRPLQILRENIGKMQISQPGQQIKWKHNDEIGQLISEYNRMTKELAISAELLAKSERESAWREMAKQVAHEIKNPLTPMKLSIQHLQKAWDAKADDFDERIRRFTNTLTQHIDALSEIATAFSDFARLPGNNQHLQINLESTIKTAIGLFEDTGNITINFNVQKGPLYSIKSNDKQLLGVFHNLLKNAIQSFGHGKPGMIDVSLSKEENHYKIEIKDNGSGIKEEEKLKIFSPSFTTKSSGMGLGLAIVRAIVESLNGTITFESQEGYGTTFRIKIPISE